MWLASKTWSLYLCAVATPTKLPSGKWRVRWIDQTGKRKQRQFDTRKQADRWAAEITRRRQDGVLASLTPSQITLEQLAQQWLQGPATELMPSTLKTYVNVIDLHVISWLGNMPVSLISLGVVQDWQASLARSGVTPDPRRRALKYLRMLLNYGVGRGYLTMNTASFAKLPKVPTSNPPSPLSPNSIERLRTSGESLDFPYAISLMGYAGLRPQEAFNLTWGDVRERTILIRSTKTNRVDAVAMLAPLAADLREWKMMSGQPPDAALVIPRARAGKWTRTAMDNWRNRVFDPACAKAGVKATPYTLRHSFASLLIHAGYPITYVAQQLRHSPAMTLKHYAHVIADMDPSVQITPEDAILQARGELQGNRLVQ